MLLKTMIQSLWHKSVLHVIQIAMFEGGYAIWGGGGCERNCVGLMPVMGGGGKGNAGKPVGGGGERNCTATFP